MAQWSRSLGVATVAALIVVTTALGAVNALSPPVVHGTPGTHSNPGSILTLSPFNAPLTANLNITPSQVHTGQSINLQTTQTGGTSPYSYSYSGLPPGCGNQNLQSFNCNPSATGTFQVQVNVTDTRGNHTLSGSATVTVTASGGGSGSGKSNNSTNPFSSLFSGLGGFLQLLIIFGIIGFATWILLIVGVWVIAIVLIRRLPKRGASASTTPTVKCAACSAAIPAGSKFCPECGAATASKST